MANKRYSAAKGRCGKKLILATVCAFVQVDCVKASSLSGREGSVLWWEQQCSVCGCLKTAPTATLQCCYKTPQHSLTAPLGFITGLKIKADRDVGYVWIDLTTKSFSRLSMQYK